MVVTDVLWNARFEQPADAEAAQPMVEDDEADTGGEEEDGEPSGGKWACTVCTFHRGGVCRCT